MASDMSASSGATPNVTNTLGTRLSVTEKIGFGLGDTASNILYQAWGFFLAKFYTDVFGLPTDHAAWLFLIARVWDMFFDPIIGMIADRTNTRWGKFRPYLLWIGVPYGALVYAMFVTPEWSPNAKIVYAYVTYILAAMAYSAINIPYSSLMAVITPDPKERTTLSQYRFFLAFVGKLLIATFMLPLVKFFGSNPALPGYNATLGYSQTVGYKMTMLLFGAIATVLLLITFLTTRERVIAPPAPAGSTRKDLHEFRRNAIFIIAALISIGLLIAVVVGRAGILAVFMPLRANLFMKVLAYAIVLGLIGHTAVTAMVAIWRTIRDTSFGHDIKDLSRNTPWVILFIACVFWLVHNMIHDGAIAYYFDYVGGRTKDALFSIPFGLFTLDFDRATTFMTIEVLGMMAGVFVSTPCKKYFGKKPLLIFLSMASAVMGAGFYVLPPDNFLMLSLYNFLWSILYGATPVFLFVMFADATDYHEWKFGRRATGLVTAGIMFAIKLGVAIGGFMQLKSLGLFGYVANVEQSAKAVTGIKLSLSIIPAAFILVCGIVLCFYPITDKLLTTIELDLKERKSKE